MHSDGRRTTARHGRCAGPRAPVSVGAGPSSMKTFEQLWSYCVGICYQLCGQVHFGHLAMLPRSVHICVNPHVARFDTYNIARQ